MCFMAQNVVSLLVNIPCELEKNVYSVFGWTTWIDTDVHYIQLIDSAFQFNYTFNLTAILLSRVSAWPRVSRIVDTREAQLQ